MRSGSLSIEEAVLGYPLEDLARRSRSGGSGTRVPGAGQSSVQARSFRAFAGNAQRSPQSVVKRIRAGGCHSKEELTRQLNYITREDAAHATWTNFAGVDRDLRANTLSRAVEDWSSSWRGAPRRGHTDHIILSFPKGTGIEAAEAVAREWGQAIFASGDYGDQWRYVAAVHRDPDHIHAHFVVDKVGCDWGNFLSISMKSDLNYDVMRECHAELSRAHGIDMVASNRLSRGIIENPPRETEYRAAHDRTGRGDLVPPPPMSDAERAHRRAVVQDFARQYSSLGLLASLSGPGNAFMEKLSQAFFASAQTLEEGGSLLPEADTLMPPQTHAATQDGSFDPVAAMTQAREQLLAEARETWESIQAMEAGPERVRMEAEFSRTSTELMAATQADPFFQDHAMVAETRDDVFAHLTAASLQHVRGGLEADDPRVGQIDSTLDDLREALTAAFAQDADLMAQLGTTPEELAEYAAQGDHSLAQAALWQGRAESLDEGASARLAAVFEEGHRIIDGVAVPRDLVEQLALDQLLTVDKHHQLADVPAIESLVDRMADTLSDAELAQILEGDSTPLQEEIRDPAVRAAVAAELKNEADLVVGQGDRERETVEAYQAMARERQAELAAEHAAERGLDIEDGHEL
ncbi:relaxase/mobilization nuclease domain-containing protein [Salipiger sp. PrR002]|uniref:relaxase/mobilization nuclease domain-containing protein n=1 Tax=Salipiger sp. PrR002 TaxID=2706489 RepID=UPI0013B79F5D|nr:relaxase/mobilization nuclease domain-containing protein [Salipiger sp. PrR002]NDW01306.1 relaxase/mobilization nuclease domain-containing protein [Salipiger sp. PrR002]NDW59812.1 relaxase/mobilization nuclease domain-containing protein [Salipiger sp. PrR004]